jgi:hypothetical protein
MPNRGERQRRSTAATIAASLVFIGVCAFIINELGKVSKSFEENSKKLTRRERQRIQLGLWCEEREAEAEASRLSIYRHPRHALTSSWLSTPVASGKPQQLISAQTQSPLFSIPLELRSMIYKLVIGQRGMLRICLIGSPRVPKLRRRRGHFHNRSPSENMLQLPMVCRKM